MASPRASLLLGSLALLLPGAVPVASDGPIVEVVATPHRSASGTFVSFGLRVRATPGAAGWLAVARSAADLGAGGAFLRTPLDVGPGGASGTLLPGLLRSPQVLGEELAVRAWVLDPGGGPPRVSPLLRLRFRAAGGPGGRLVEVDSDGPAAGAGGGPGDRTVQRAVAAPSAGQCVAVPNLLRNPGGEEGLREWTTLFGKFSSSTAAAFSGDRSFRAGDGVATSHAKEQVVDLWSRGFPPGLIPRIRSITYVVRLRTATPSMPFHLMRMRLLDPGGNSLGKREIFYAPCPGQNCFVDWVELGTVFERSAFQGQDVRFVEIRDEAFLAVTSADEGAFFDDSELILCVE